MAKTPLRILLLSSLLLGFGRSGRAAAQEPAPARETIRYATGTFSGSVKGTRDTTLYNGDHVVETIDCTVTMTFYEDGTMTFDTGRYYYEKTYTKKTTTGGSLVSHTRIEADGFKGTRTSQLRLGVTQYNDVWRAGWTLTAEAPGHHTFETWLTDGQGRTWGHNTIINKYERIRCEPQVLWRGRNKQGPGLPLRGQGSWQDVAKLWATDVVSWNFTVMR